MRISIKDKVLFLNNTNKKLIGVDYRKMSNTFFVEGLKLNRLVPKTNHFLTLFT